MLHRGWTSFRHILATNLTKRYVQVALWNQKAARRPDGVVIWDYHVILILKPLPAHIAIDGSDHRSWVYDLDSTLCTPCPMVEYLHRTFLPTPEEFQSSFRVIPVDLFLKYFASDRRHMLRKSIDAQITPEIGEPLGVDCAYISPLPSWPAIRGNLATTENNLMEKYVRMEDYPEVDESGGNVNRRYGSIYTLAQIALMAGASGDIYILCGRDIMGGMSIPQRATSSHPSFRS